MANLYTEGAVNNIATFRDHHSPGRLRNPTVPESVRSNLTNPRTHRRLPGPQVTWNELMKANEKWEVRTSRG